jgi:hypothetical protein
LNILRLDFQLLGSVDMPILCKLLDINVPFIDENNIPDDQFPVKYNTQEFLKAFRCSRLIPVENSAAVHNENTQTNWITTRR